MFSIGQLAKMSNLTVRTLRYYDEIGLLKPSRVSEGNHRYYDEKAVEKLQNIIFLKELGFDLETIRSILDETIKSSKELLELRLEMITEEQARLEQKKQNIQAILELMELEGKQDWESIFQTLSTFRNYDFRKIRSRWKMYFSEEEQKILQALPKIGDENPLTKRYVELVKETRENLHVDPASEKGQELMKKWTDLFETMYQGNWELANKVWQLHFKGDENLGFYDYDSDLMAFFDAMQEYDRKQTNS